MRRPRAPNERHFNHCRGDGTVACPRPFGQPAVEVQRPRPTRAPTIALANRSGNARPAARLCSCSYKIEDDYGVTEAQAHFYGPAS